MKVKAKHHSRVSVYTQIYLYQIYQMPATSTVAKKWWSDRLKVFVRKKTYSSLQL